MSKGRTDVINNKAFFYHCLQSRIRCQNPQRQVELLIQQQWTKFNGITLQTKESVECNTTQVQPDKCPRYPLNSFMWEQRVYM